MQVQFGELFFGESATRCLTLVNNGPTEACFDLSFGSVSDLKALLSGGPDDDVMSGSQDDRLAAFLQVARIRVSQHCSSERGFGAVSYSEPMHTRHKVLHSAVQGVAWLGHKVAPGAFCAVCPTIVVLK